jgi:hypothetical protein
MNVKAAAALAMMTVLLPAYKSRSGPGFACAMFAGLTFDTQPRVAVLLDFFRSPYAQNGSSQPDSKSAPKAQSPPSQEKQHFYYHSWAKGEFKICETYSGAPSVVLCESDDDMQWKNSFMNMIGDNNRAGMVEDQSYHQALAFAAAHGKTFLATFSEDPWPQPQTGLKLSVWNCSMDKNKLIACALGGRTTRTTTGE